MNRESIVDGARLFDRLIARLLDDFLTGPRLRLPLSRLWVTADFFWIPSSES